MTPWRRRPCAARLDELNQERRSIEAKMQTDAQAAVRGLANPQPGTLERHGVVLFDESWHQGVVGLVASRIKERLRRPVIAFALADATTLRGSARSVPGVHIRDVLEAIATREPQLVSRFGGHAMAAGLVPRATPPGPVRACLRCGGAALAGTGPADGHHRDRRRAQPRRDCAGDRPCPACRRTLGPGIPGAQLRWAVQHQERAGHR